MLRYFGVFQTFSKYVSKNFFQKLLKYIKLWCLNLLGHPRPEYILNIYKNLMYVYNIYIYIYILACVLLFLINSQVSNVLSWPIFSVVFNGVQLTLINKPEWWYFLWKLVVFKFLAIMTVQILDELQEFKIHYRNYFKMEDNAL